VCGLFRRIFPRIFRNAHGAWLSIAALAYTLAGWALGVVLLAADSWYANVAGVLLTGHALVYSAYFVHELAHQSVFSSAEANHRFGVLMSWINGSCYAPFQALRRKHMRHHTERADVLTFDYKKFLNTSPSWVRKPVVAAEWAWIPAVELIMHAYVVVLPFAGPARRAERPRVIAVVAIRVAAFAVLGWVSLKALFLYGVAYMIMLHALRFADAYQHTYDAFAVLQEGDVPDDKIRDRDYEQANTYTNLVSVAHPWLNLLLLNFSYHNAHHERPIVPWHDLPKLHRQLFPAEYVQIIPMIEVVRGYHRDRVARILSDDYGEVNTAAAAGKADRFLGAAGVSFLTAV
jgi:fatty acid desaturase